MDFLVFLVHVIYTLKLLSLSTVSHQRRQHVGAGGRAGGVASHVPDAETDLRTTGMYVFEG